MKLLYANVLDKKIGRHCDFFVNGENVNALGVFEASEEDGWCVVADAERRENGTLRFVPEYGSPYNCRTRMLRGEVKIQPMADEYHRRCFESALEMRNMIDNAAALLKSFATDRANCQ